MALLSMPAVGMDTGLGARMGLDSNVQVFGLLAELCVPLLAGLTIASLVVFWRSKRSDGEQYAQRGSVKVKKIHSASSSRKVEPDIPMKVDITTTASEKDDSTVSPMSSNSSSSSVERETVYHQSFWRGPHMQGTLIPSTGMMRFNPDEPYAFENRNCSGQFLPLHRPTHDAALDRSGKYPYGSHFASRKRLWELRIQFQVKQPVDGNLMIGLELENYVPLNAAAKKFMGLTVAALRKVVGNDLYHSVGDDPQQGSTPHEKPVFMMPMWACDQLLITPVGEEPPDMTSPHFSTFGMKRVDDRKAFVKEMEGLKFAPGSIYTVCFWGISQFLDCQLWKVQRIVPFKTIDFDQFCGRPPVTVVMYTLNASEGGDLRHIQSRKNYFFRYALWSSERPPSAEKLRELIPTQGDLGTQMAKKVEKGGACASLFKRYSPVRWLGCCAAPR